MIYSTMAVLLCWVSLMLNVAKNHVYAKCRYAECYFAECQYAECRGALFKWLKKFAYTQKIILIRNTLAYLSAGSMT
jgi:hypothetical protein